MAQAADDSTLLAQDIEPKSEKREPLSIPPPLLERFGELHFLGAGGMGAVYRARDRRLDRDVALKFLHGTDPETSRLLMREARSQARLTHDNACKVYEVGVEGHRPYIVMQYIDGKPLDSASERMTLEEKVRAIRQVAGALHEAHRLGIVHRDVKPSNIMVEQSEDGAYKPYIMDFGIAREIGTPGQTTISVIAGTPAYMAPEQAWGDILALDRRADVYSLGATLYDVLSGRPPFEGTNPLMVLQRVQLEEPKGLRKVRSEVPEDLEAIVMKCLEKEPGRRYESAKALGEDLQRFLDGEPVQARRASLAYVLLKSARKHKARVGLGVALFIVASVLGGFWLSERQAMAEQAAISRELGENVKEMELFLRHAQALPLHDIERERFIVRLQLRGIEERMASLGRAGEGPGYYALGRGFLALQEPEKALSHLRRALAAGYTQPELRYAMGLALGELYRKALEETKRIQNEERKKARIAAIDAEYKTPALEHLRAALGARLESPAYVEGLIALYEGRNDAALAKAREAFDLSPWLHEAKKLEGDARFVEGSRWRRDAAFDYGRMMKEFEPAAAAYAEAAEMARSDPAVHEAACDLWIQVVFASDARPELLRSSFEKAKRACENAITADSRSGSARMKLAFAHNAFAWQMANGQEEKDSALIIQEAVLRSGEALRFRPSDAMAHYLVGAACRTEVNYLLNRGVDARASIDRAIAALEEAIRIDPGFLWPYSEVCASYTERARNEILHGAEPRPSVDRAIARCDQATALDPSITYPVINKALAHFRMAQYLLERGRSPESAVASVLASAAAIREQNAFEAAKLSAWALWILASYECDAGQDPESSLRRAEQFVAEMEQVAPSPANYEIKGLLLKTRALYLLRQGKDPIEELRDARELFQKIRDASPWDIDYRIWQARAEIIGLRWAILQDKVDAAMFDAAFGPLLPLLDEERADPRFYQTLAEIYALRAAWPRAKSAERDLASGLEMADKALALNPHMAKAFATKGAVLLSQGRVERIAKTRSDTARKVKESFEAALRENPLLAAEVGSALKEAERLVASR